MVFGVLNKFNIESLKLYKTNFIWIFMWYLYEVS
jgi:hypothetical protein